MSLYQEIAKHLRQKIEDGNYQPGEALPRQTDLASEYNTSRVTIQKALDMLFNDNLIPEKPKCPPKFYILKFGCLPMKRANN